MLSIFLVTLLLGLLLNQIAVLLGLRIKTFRSHLAKDVYGVSKLGGMALVFSFFFSVVVFIFFSPIRLEKTVVFLTALGLAFLLGVFDDLLNLKPFQKLFYQFLISFFLVFFGIRTQIVFFSPFLNQLFSILWFLAIMNAFNFLDIVDGLAAGIAAECAGTFLLISVMTHNTTVGICALALLASNLSFLFFNLAPAKLYMGDTGSLFNGCAFAGIAIMSSYATPGREMALLVPLLILALPLYDLLFVIVLRWRDKKSLMKKSRDHFILRLLDKGWSWRRSIILLFILNMFFNAAALLILKLSNLLSAIVVFLAVASWLFFAYKVGKHRLKEAGV